MSFNAFEYFTGRGGSRQMPPPPPQQQQPHPYPGNSRQSHDGGRDNHHQRSTSQARSPSPNKVSTAEGHKLKGNIFFQQKLYDEAIREYTIAIIQNPEEAVYFTNRGLCYLRLGQFEKVIADCRKAITLQPKSVKAHYFLGQALLESLDIYINESVAMLRKAYDLSLEQGVTFSEDIARTYRQSRKRKWEINEARRRERESSMYAYLKGLIMDDLARNISTPGLDSASREVFVFDHRERLQQLDDLLERVNDPGQKREVPEYYCGKITFEIMTDPVVTPSGITYDRTEIVQHLRKVGHFDPISREPLTEKDLVPNLSLKEAISDYLDENGWAVDY